MSRKIRTTPDVLLILSTLFLGVTTLLAYLDYGHLPEVIPAHFDFMGTVDGYRPKSSLWMFILIGWAIHGTLSFLLYSRYEKMEERARRVLALSIVFLVLFVVMISHDIFSIANNEQVGLHPLTSISLVLYLGVVLLLTVMRPWRTR